mgnify:FL=1
MMYVIIALLGGIGVALVIIVSSANDMRRALESVNKEERP